MSTELSRKLRRDPPTPERAMWAILYPLRQRGAHFRRQVQIGPYFVDFASHQARLVIEVDGDTHGTDAGARRDGQRDGYLRSRGYRVLRFWNSDVMTNAEGVYTLIETALMEAMVPSPTPDPSPQGGGRRQPHALGPGSV